MNVPSASDSEGDHIAHVASEEWTKVVAVLTSELRDIALAEEVTQDAFAAALEQWPSSGVPQRPGAWLLTVARRRAIDRIRREATGRSKVETIGRLEARLSPAAVAIDSSLVRDEQLQLLFACSHPALSVEVQLALVLRCVAGVSTPDLAAAFLISESAMAQRLVRGKRKIRDSAIPLSMPADSEILSRISVVHQTIYLIYNNGYVHPSGELLIENDLTEEAIRLARLVVRLIPSDPESKGLLALFLLSESRRPARTDCDNNLVLLADQDRSKWDQSMISEGNELIAAAIRREQPGPYQIQAAINALHCDAKTAEDTDWPQIELLYHSLVQHTPTPIVKLNLAVAISMSRGPAEALPLLDRLMPELEKFHYAHAARAEILVRLERYEEARAAYREALELVRNESERTFLNNALAEL